jgi:pyruvate formate lyase activating enzyme
MNTSVVLNIQRFSVHDGPGIRTTVFFKGCPLHCPWCHNPESMDPRPQIAIRADQCLGCEACAPACPEEGAGRLDLSGTLNRPGSVCVRCGSCAEACPSGAREELGMRLNVADLMAELERDRPYYEESGGGVTFSGGEPITPSNADFLNSCLEECGKRGLHRTVDTCGHVPARLIRSVAERADLLLYDLKIMDPRRHRDLVGVDNELILGNLRDLAAAGRGLRIRVPLIPGMTDDDRNLRAIARFVRELERPIPVHLLPHHGSAGQKYHRLGLVDPAAAVAPPTDEVIEEKAELIRAAGLEVIIGG